MALVASRKAVVVAKAARPCRAARVTISRPRLSGVRMIVRAEPEKSAIETAIKDAEKSCADGSEKECAAAWDTVEELSAAASHKKDTVVTDPLEKFCESNPEADECRVYED